MPNGAAFRLLPATAAPAAGRVLTARALRALVDGYVAVLLPVYLGALGFDPVDIGIIATATLLGSALATLAVGLYGHRWPQLRLLLAAGLLMAATGAGFAALEAYLPLLLIAFVGTLNPSGGDVSLFLPLEHAVLARSVAPAERTALFARYSLVGAVGAAIGALASGLADWLAPLIGTLPALRLMFVIYAAVGVAVFALYRGLTVPADPEGDAPAPALGPSRRRVVMLASLFAVDAFAGGFVINALVALWLMQRFGLSAAAVGTVFFVTGLCAAASFLAAAPVARRIGLVNTMVFTHLPANAFLIAAALAPEAWIAISFLVLRGLLSQMDVPTRTSYVMAVVTPPERPAAASLTAVPRSLAAAASPALAGWLLGVSPFGWPLVIGGALKIAYDLALLGLFRNVTPPEEH